jgi:hypothetical protein
MKTPLELVQSNDMIYALKKLTNDHVNWIAQFWVFGVTNDASFSDPIQDSFFLDSTKEFVYLNT